MNVEIIETNQEIRVGDLVEVKSAFYNSKEKKGLKVYGIIGYDTKAKGFCLMYINGELHANASNNHTLQELVELYELKFVARNDDIGIVINKEKEYDC